MFDSNNEIPINVADSVKHVSEPIMRYEETSDEEEDETRIVIDGPRLVETRVYYSPHEEAETSTATAAEVCVPIPSDFAAATFTKHENICRQVIAWLRRVAERLARALGEVLVNYSQSVAAAQIKKYDSFYRTNYDD